MPPQLALPLDDGWSPVTVDRLGRRAPLAAVRVQVGPRLVLLQVRAGARACDVHLRAEGGGPGPGELRLQVAFAPVFMLSTQSDAVVPLHWGLARTGHLGDPGEFFGHALRWGVSKLAWRAPRGWRRPIQAALASLLREAAGAVAGQLAPALRAATLRFPPRRRAALYAQLLRDDRGWLRQALAATPGAVLYALALAGHEETEDAGVRLALALKDGLRLDAALTAANEAWRAALLPWARDRSRFPDPARRAFAVAAAAPAAQAPALERAQRLLVRRAGPHVEPALLLLPPPERLIPEDIPAEPRANAAWYEVMKVPGVTVAAAGLGQPDDHRRAFAAFASRHAVALRGVPAGLSRRTWLEELSALLRDSGRAPSRSTDPRALVASVDLEALRRRLAPYPVRFLHPADGHDRPHPVDPGHRPAVLAAEPPAPPPEPSLCRCTIADWSRDGLSVHQLTTWRELQAEGVRQRNCVVTYADQVEAGRVLVLSVQVAGRSLTLSLVRRDGRLRVSEFKGFANRPANGAEWAALAQWLPVAGVTP